ncbi:MAG: WhiB family transcriptional regulator [Pseudonocardia sp.]
MNEAWREEALCQQTDPTLFHPEPDASTRDAKRTCNACPVRLECRDYAITNGEQWGIWGGIEQAELRRLIRVRRAETAA